MLCKSLITVVKFCRDCFSLFCKQTQTSCECHNFLPRSLSLLLSGDFHKSCGSILKRPPLLCTPAFYVGGPVHLAHLRRKGCALCIPQEGAWVRPAGQLLTGELIAEAQRSWAGLRRRSRGCYPNEPLPRVCPEREGPRRAARRAGVSSPPFWERASFQHPGVWSGAHSSSDAFGGPSVGPGPGRRPPHVGQRGSGAAA